MKIREKKRWSQESQHTNECRTIICKILGCKYAFAYLGYDNAYSNDDDCNNQIENKEKIGFRKLQIW